MVPYPMPELQKSFLQISPHDNLLVALKDLDAGTYINWDGSFFKLTEDIPAKHKFAPVELKKWRTGSSLWSLGR